MDETERKIQKHYGDWRAAEVRYAKSLEEFGGDRPPAKVKKESALALAKARQEADSARDKYFKRALK